MLGQDSVVGSIGDSGACSGRTCCPWLAGTKNLQWHTPLSQLLAWQYTEPMFGLVGGHWALLTQGTHRGLLGGSGAYALAALADVSRIWKLMELQ